MNDNNKTIVFDDSVVSKQLKKLVESMTPGLALDVGCGKGKSAIWLAQHSWIVEAFDSHQPSLQIAKERCKEKKLEITFYQSDITSFQTDRRYDLIVCAMVLHFLDDQAIIEAVKKFKQLLKQNGQVYISVMTDENLTDTRPNLFHKGQLESYFKDWKIERSYRIKSDPILMPYAAKAEVKYFEYLLATKN